MKKISQRIPLNPTNCFLPENVTRCFGNELERLSCNTMKYLQKYQKEGMDLACFSGKTLARGEKMNTGDTAFLLVSAALVMLMTPGLALFYGGMVRTKNVLGTIMQSFIIIGLISLEWLLWGYSMAFGPDKFGIIGGLEWVGLRGVGMEPHATYAPTVPHQVFMIYQCMFAVITPALITGAFAERMRFGPFLFFSLLWATFVYNPLAHWIWGSGGWLSTLGALDFAGGVRSPEF
jgi:Amt family ammonium transporter